MMAIASPCASEFPGRASTGASETASARNTSERAWPLGYSIADIWDIRAQARVTAFMWKNQQRGQWTCAR